MTSSSPSALLEPVLRHVVRRYGLPPLDTVPDTARSANPAVALAVSIERARQALAQGRQPDEASAHAFVEALARMIREAMHVDHGDPAFQALLLRHRVPAVAAYAALAAEAGGDERRVRAAVDALAHPGRRGEAPAHRHAALARLHAHARAGAWQALADEVARLDAALTADGEAGTPLAHGLARVRHSEALARGQRLAALAADADVARYRALEQRYRPLPDSAAAAAVGAAAQRRGAAVEADVADALGALAWALQGRADGHASYRVVTSMRVPAALSAGRERAKTEWDAVLLGRSATNAPADGWSICLLVEAKASVDAAATDFPRLVRGVQVLAQADPAAVHTFQAREGAVGLSGASLAALRTDAATLARTVLYCSDAPADRAPRLLGAPGRMALLSASASLAFAAALAEGEPVPPDRLLPVWRALLTSPRWERVLRQYPMLCRSRALMVHVDDLRAAAGAVPT